MLRYFVMSLALMALNSNTLFANVGVFSGYGHTIELSKSEDIQMVSEEVEIIPGRGRFLFNGSVPGMDRVEYKCKFKLKNLTNQDINIRVGFPLNSQFLKPPYNTKLKTSELIIKYNFIAQVEGHIFNITYTPGDKSQNLKNLFLWDMTFLKNEEKELLVSYSMPISMTLARTFIENSGSKYSKQWYKELEKCQLEIFGYVTETGNSWAGTIERATFKVYVAGFEKYLSNRTFIEGLNKNKTYENSKKYIPQDVVFFLSTEPDGWIPDHKGYLTLTQNDYVPQKNIIFKYYILYLPKNNSEINRLLGYFSKFDFQSEDYEDLRDIFYAFNGESPKNERIMRFLKNQRWYGNKPQIKIPEEVFRVIEQQLN